MARQDPCTATVQPSEGGAADNAAQDARLVAVAPDSDEWRTVCDLVSRESQPHLLHYGFSLEVARLHQVRPGRLQREQRQLAAALGEPTLLFHGTWSDNVEGILRKGFLLPLRNIGMFGRGIYFADCPLKSVQFAKKKEKPRQQKFWQQHWHHVLGCLSGFAAGCALGGGCIAASLSSVGGAYLGDRMARIGHALPKRKKKQTMLVCEVFLGKSQTVSRPKKVNPLADLKRGWMMRALGAQDYNSVYVPGGRGYAVRVPEYVVYEPYQAIPKYVIEFTCKPIRSS